MLIGHARAHSVLHVHHKRTVWLQPGYVHRDRHALEPATAHCPDEGPLRRRRFVRGAQQAHRRRRCLYRGLGEASLEKRAIEWAERRSRYEIRCVQSPPDGGLRSKRDWRMCERQGLPTIAGAKREDTIAQDILQGYSESDTSYINLYQGHSLEWECFQKLGEAVAGVGAPPADTTSATAISEARSGKLPSKSSEPNSRWLAASMSPEALMNPADDGREDNGESARRGTRRQA
jgi:hypothetical protein